MRKKITDEQGAAWLRPLTEGALRRYAHHGNTADPEYFYSYLAGVLLELAGFSEGPTLLLLRLREGEKI